MHNGGIAEFPKIKRKLQAVLSDELFDVVQGNTGMSKSFPGARTPSLTGVRFGVGFCAILVEGAEHLSIETPPAYLKTIASRSECQNIHSEYLKERNGGCNS
jgi:hypothetical protein